MLRGGPVHGLAPTAGPGTDVYSAERRTSLFCADQLGSMPPGAYLPDEVAQTCGFGAVRPDTDRHCKPLQPATLQR